MRAGGVPARVLILLYFSGFVIQTVVGSDIYWEGEEDAANEFLEVNEDQPTVTDYIKRVKRGLFDWFNTLPDDQAKADADDEKDEDVEDNNDGVDNEDDAENFGSGDNGVELDPKEKTIRVSFVVMEPYQAEFSNRDSPQFQNISKSLADAVNALYENLPGNQRANLVRIQSLTDEFSCNVTLEILTSGNDNTKRIIDILQDHIIAVRQVGPFTVEEKGFSAKVFDTEAEHVDAECSEGQHRCENGQCVPKCDRVQDCLDGSDELNCQNEEFVEHECGENEFRCSDGICAPKCDGYAQCIDGADESNCDNPDVSENEISKCAEDEYHCSDDSCVPKCNGIPECSDGADENDCEYSTDEPSCDVGEHLCNNGQCVPKCDRSADCADGSDEFDCVYACSSTEMHCDGTRCVSLKSKCDGRRDCDDGTDELNCPETCGIDDFRCSNGRCIKSDERCNRIVDCPDGDDEYDCECTEDEFRCQSTGSCIEGRKKCDGFSHCEDGSDEFDCACSSDQWQCDLGSCIKRVMRCDGRVDCPSDRSDERNCFASGQFRCQSGKLIPGHLRCNRHYDCPRGDYSDEKNCPCGPNDFHCGNGHCISASKHCDGTHDCQDGTDEHNCENAKAQCMPTQYKCSNDECVQADARCNGIKECQDGSDERGCPCKRDEFHCRGGSCINIALRCNRIKDCPAGDDEYNCEFCPFHYWRCGNGKCIHHIQLCDGYYNCPDKSDELRCFPQAQTRRIKICAPGEFTCRNGDCAIKCDSNPTCEYGEDEVDCQQDCSAKCDDGRCIASDKICDGKNDCLDYSDEINCASCEGPNDFRCENGECINAALHCNGYIDCTDESDEFDCNSTMVTSQQKCTESQFQCKDGACIDSYFLCDQVRDCIDNSDEEDCGNSAGCSENEFQCLSGKCIPSYLRCNDVVDCSDQSDEINCPTQRPEITELPPYLITPANVPTMRPYTTTASPIYTQPPPPLRPYYPNNQDGYDGCNRNQWRCENGPCIDSSRRCDGQYDCPLDDSDELDCPPGSPPPLKLRTYPSDQSMRYGGDVVFRCRDEGSLQAPVRWIREGGRPLKPGSMDKKGRLEMFQVTPSDSGVYICQAPGYLGQPGSEMRVTLSVESEPYKPKPPAFVACKSYEATCGNGQCIPKSAVCDGRYDCADRSDESSCNENGKCQPNEYQCANRRCVLKTWLCDSEDDCGDNSDEQNCGTSAPGQVCQNVEFECASKNQCVPKSFHCDGQSDCLDGSDEFGCAPIHITKPPAPQNVRLNPGDTLVLVCEAVGVPTPLITWRLNWGFVPDKCHSNSLNGIGTLTCPNMQPNDSGAYSCEAINHKGTTFAVPDAIVYVNKTDVCPSGYFNSEASSPGECIRCFCFGESTQCTSADLYTYNMPTPLGEGGTRLVGVKQDYYGGVEIDTQPITDLYYYQPLRNGASITKLENFATKSSHPYVTLPETYNGNQLTSYGGFIKYRVQPHLQRFSYGTNVPDIIVKGKFGTLVHYHRHGNELTKEIQARFTPDDWKKSDSRGVSPATREDIMMALDNVEVILLRGDLNGAGVNISDFTMESAQHINAGLGAANLVEQCQCPPGYEGLSCQKCSSGYSRDRSGQWLGNCVRDEKPCPPGTYGSPSSGYGCNPCPCPLTNRENNFASTCSLAPNGRVICDCMPGYEGPNCERCAPGFVGNPLIPGDSCQPGRSDNCNPIGTSLVRQPDQCECKENVQGRYCDQCNDYSFFLSEDFRHGCARCFCSGVSQQCSSTSYRRETTTAVFNNLRTANEVKVYNSTLGSPTGPFRYNIPVETDLKPTLSNGELKLETDRARPTIYYWSLPASFSGDKVTSYGGFLRYTLRNVPQNVRTYLRNNASDVQLISDNQLTFHYFHQENRVPANYDNTVEHSVQFLEKGWQRADGKEVQREHLLLALADVKTILIKATYGGQTATLVSASIETATPDGNGPQAFHVEQCICPTGYLGTSCEDCAPGYTRNENGLYLENCGPCDCNGHSNMCDPQTGVCYDCADNTAGDNCELCKPNYTKDRYGNCVQESSQPCNCDPRGEAAPCEGDTCVCKRNVDGSSCDRCRPGFFGLDENNPDGCIPCYCSGVSTDCHEANYYQYQPIPATIFGENNGGFTLMDINARNVINDNFVQAAKESELIYVFSFPPNDDLYWSLPFSGNRILSYGGSLSLSQRFESNGYGEKSVPGVDAVLVGDDVSLYWRNPNEIVEGQSLPYQIPLLEDDWYNLETQAPASRHEFMNVLKKLRRVLIKATLSSSIISTAIADVEMATATEGNLYQPAKGIEICVCPEGYTGTSCETCKPGYYKDNRDNCRQCPCNGHDCTVGPNSNVICNCRPPYTGQDCASVGLIMELHPTVVDIGNSDSHLRKIKVTCKYAAPEPLTIQFYFEGKEIKPPKLYNESTFSQKGWHGSHEWSTLWDIHHRGHIVECHTVTKTGSTLGMLTSSLPDPGGEPSTEYTTRPPPPQSTVVVRITSPTIKIREIGGTVNFTCQALSRNSQSPLTVKWRKDNGYLPQGRYYTYDGTLLLTGLQVTDSGRYICEATDGVSTEQAAANLQVPGNGFTKPTVTIKPAYNDYYEGDRIELECVARGNPIPTIRWQRASNRPLPSGVVSTESFLVIEPAREEDSGEYRCTATNAAGDTDRVAFIQIRPRVPRPYTDKLVISPTSANITEGQSTRVVCTGTANVPPGSIGWIRRDGMPLQTNIRSDNGILYIDVARLENQGVYMCQTANPDISPIPIIVSVQPAGTPSPLDAPSVSVADKSVTIPTGETRVIDCTPSGTPLPTVLWKKKEEPLGQGTSQRENSLIISNAQEENSGYYVCEGIINGQRAAQVYVNVDIERREPPVVEIMPQGEQTVQLGSRFEFYCRVVSGTPLPRDVIWDRTNGRSLSPHVQISINPHTLRFDRVDVNDEGEYRCSASNIAGRHNASAILKVTSPPVITILPVDYITKKRGEPITVECHASGYPEPMVSITKDSNRLEIQPPTPGAAVLRVDAASYDDDDTYTCTATSLTDTRSAQFVIAVEDSDNDDVESGSGYEPDTNPGQGQGEEQPKRIIAREGDNPNIICEASDDFEIQWNRGVGIKLQNNAVQIGNLLKIYNVSSSDEDYYECVLLDRITGQPVKSEFTFLQIYPSDYRDPSIIRQPRITLRPQTQTVMPGQSPRVECHVDGDEILDIVWRSLDRPISNRVEIRGSVLIFHQIEVEDAGHYECFARNRIANATAVAEVLVNDYGLQPAESYSHEQVAHAGSAVHLRCNVRQPNLKISWTKNGRPLPRSITQRNDGSLLIRLAQKSDSGHYVCTIKDHYGRNTTNYINLHIEGNSDNSANYGYDTSAPARLVSIDQPQRQFKVGENVQVLCRAMSRDIQVKWRRVPNQFVESVTYGDGSLLRIPGVEESDAGNYECIGQELRQNGRTSYDNFILEVIPGEEDPYPTDDQDSIKTAHLLNNVELPCNHNLEEPAHIEWRREYVPLPSHIRTNDRTLHLARVTEKDAGTYVCRVSNSRAAVESRAILRVVGVVPQFDGAAWVSLPSLKDAYSQFDIEISLKPMDGNGLIFYNSQNQGRGGDFIALQLVDGVPEFILEPGDGPFRVQGNRPLQLNNWHTIRISRIKTYLTMDVDNSFSSKTDLSNTPWTPLELNQPFYIGGVPDYDQLPPQLITTGFIGCVSMLILDRKEKNIMADRLDIYNVKDCDTCSPNVCLNNGVCQEARNEHGYSCICPAGFAGLDCSRTGEACHPGLCGVGKCVDTTDGYKCSCPVTHTGKRCENEQKIEYPAFTGSAYLAIKTPQAFRIFKMIMKLKAQPVVTDGIIMYCAESARGIGGFISLAVKDGKLEYRYDVGDGYGPVILTSAHPLQANEWTVVQITRIGQMVTMTVNGVETIRGKVYTPKKELRLETPLFVGGYDDSIVLNNNTAVTGGFYGCIKDVTVPSGAVDIVTSSIQSANVQECSNSGERGDIPESETLCSQCRNNGYCTTPDATACTCQPGFSGLYCENREPVSRYTDDPCLRYPCKNGGTCKQDSSKRSRYSCDCPLGYGGANCQMPLELLQAVGFGGNGYLELPAHLIKYDNLDDEPAVIALAIHTTSDGVLLYQGEQNKPGLGDFILLRVEDGKVVMEWDLGGGLSRLTVDEVAVNDGERHQIIAKLLGNRGAYLSVDMYSRSGVSQGLSNIMNADSNIYIGGIPEGLNVGRHPGFTGCFEQVELMSTGRGLNLGLEAVAARNTQYCRD